MTRATRGLLSIVTAFFAGVLVDSWLRVFGPPMPVQTPAGTPVASPSAAPLAPISAVTPAVPVATTGKRGLRVPIEGVDVEAMKGGFSEARTGHPHEAVDFLVPRNTPVHAVQDGTIAKLFVSKAGGNTIYQFDPSGERCYYYAHLQRYADGLHDGDPVQQGEVIGYVGTSGNAPPDTPHLHFAVFELGPERQWWKGKALDPYLVFKGAGG